MAKVDAGSIIVVLSLILVFLLVILGMLTKCGAEVADFLNESTTITYTSESLL